MNSSIVIAERKKTSDKKKGSLISNLKYDFKYNKAILLMTIPGLLWLLIFRYVPMYGVLIAFKKYSLFKGFLKSEWVGFRYFIQFFEDPYFFRLLKNTFLLGLYNMLWSFPAPIILALLLNEVKNKRFKKFTQTVTYMPYFISTVVIVGIMKSMFASDGVINHILHSSVPFFNSPDLFRTLYISSDIWSTIGYGSIIYLAAITGIDPELYEAAKIDGASRLQNIIYITIPSIIPTITVLLILRVGAVLSVGFEKVFLMYSPATYQTADIISTYVYRKGIQDQNFSFATAVGLFNSVISLILLTVSNYFSKKTMNESLW
ncbi:ABC transporter permease subunit [Clostridium swellfunianum]|uniref:ABC transporter permease n=1 Tax=Clostridium swellfunianum TaxID=1367462 RepID=UPI00202E6A09|nr:ABC transporter permease subunit [Clostridium swellfunianum]MCM0646993.1 ABC transporter permease subunit [Clostridium swellfunianum]